MKYVDVAEFVPRCLEYVDEVEATGVTIVVLQNGRPFVYVKPYVDESVSGGRGGGTDPAVDPRPAP